MTYEEGMESMKYRDSTGREPAGSSWEPEAERARRGQLVGQAWSTCGPEAATEETPKEFQNCPKREGPPADLCREGS